MRTGTSKQKRDRFANAPAGAGHKRGLSAQIKWICIHDNLFSQ